METKQPQSIRLGIKVLRADGTVEDHGEFECVVTKLGLRDRIKAFFKKGE